MTTPLFSMFKLCLHHAMKILEKSFKKVLTKELSCGILIKLIQTEYALVAQLDRVTGYEPVGRGFESLQARQKRKRKFASFFIFIAVLGTRNMWKQLKQVYIFLLLS